MINKAIIIGHVGQDPEVRYTGNATNGTKVAQIRVATTERYKDKDGKVTGVIEKGIDTWFALDTYELALYRDFDYVVLITGDADHEMLIRNLKALKAHVILLTWDPAGTNSTSPALREEACTHIEISKLMEEDKDLYKYLTKKI